MQLIIDAIPSYVIFGFLLCLFCGFIGFVVRQVWQLLSHLILHK